MDDITRLVFEVVARYKTEGGDPKQILDDLTGKLDKYGKGHKDTREHVDTHSISTGVLLRHLNQLASGLLGGVNPALAGMSSELTNAARLGIHFSATTGIMVTGIGVAVLAVRELIARFNETTKAAAELRLGIDSLDVSGFRSKMASAAGELYLFEQRATTTFGRLQNLAEHGLTAMFGGQTPQQRLVSSAAGFGATYARTEGPRAAADAMLAQVASQRSLAEFQAKYASSVADVERSFKTQNEALQTTLGLQQQILKIENDRAKAALEVQAISLRSVVNEMGQASVRAASEFGQLKVPEEGSDTRHIQGLLGLGSSRGIQDAPGAEGRWWSARGRADTARKAFEEAQASLAIIENAQKALDKTLGAVSGAARTVGEISKAEQEIAEMLRKAPFILAQVNADLEVSRAMAQGRDASTTAGLAEAGAFRAQVAGMRGAGTAPGPAGAVERFLASMSAGERASASQRISGGEANAADTEALQRFFAQIGIDRNERGQRNSELQALLGGRAGLAEQQISFQEQVGEISSVEAMSQRLLVLQDRARNAAAELKFLEDEIIRINAIPVSERTDEENKLLPRLASQRDLAQQGAAGAQFAVRGGAAALTERTEFATSFRMGLYKVSEDMTNWSQQLQGIMRSTAQGMSGAMTDGFFAVVEGRFKDLPNIGRQWAQQMVRSIIQTLSDQTIGNTIKQLLGGATGGYARGGVPAGLLAGGGAGGGIVGGSGNVITIAGQTYQVGAQTGGGMTFTPVAPAGGGPNSPGVSLGPSMVDPTWMGRAWTGMGDSVANFGAMWNAPLWALTSSDVVFSGGQMITNAGELAMAGQASAGVAGQSAAMGSGLSLGAAAGGALAIAGLGLTIYTGLAGQPGGPNATSIGTGAVSGALSGAMIGFYAGTVWPGVGNVVGAVVGAIAGAIVGGGAAAAGKDTTASETRQKKEAERATGAAQQMVDEINAAATPELLYAIITSWGSGYTGGTHSVAIMVQVKGATGVGPGTGASEAPLVGIPNPTYRVATLDELIENPQDITASVQAGVDQSMLSQANQAVASAIQSKIGELMAMAGIEVSSSRMLTGDIRRTTSVPGSLAGRLSGPLDITAQSLLGMTDDQKAAFLKELRRVDVERSLRIIARDPETNQLVSVTDA